MKDPFSSVSAHKWRFFRAGGFDQVSLESGDDLLALQSLDQKLWVVLSCPTSDVEFDRRTLDIIDSDHDGHIRVPEILSSISWIAARISDADLLLKGGKGVPLVSIDTTTEEGKQLLSSVRAILSNLSNADSEYITVDDVIDYSQSLSLAKFNGDGVITATSSDDEEIKGWIADIIKCLGGKPDRNGDIGITKDMVEQFSSEISLWLKWQNAPNQDKAIPVSGGTRAGLLKSWMDVKRKIDDFFLRCRLAAFDSRAADILSGAEDDLKNLVKKYLSDDDDDIAALPLAAVNRDQVLKLETGLNPAWHNKILQVRKN